MGSLRSFLLLTALGASGPAALAVPFEGAKPDEPSPVASRTPASAPTPVVGTPPTSAGPASSTTEVEPPVPPRQYLEAGAKLFNKGRYDLAAKYLQAAHLYRDRLNDNERVVLDVYKEKLDHYRRSQAPSPASVSAPAGSATTPGPVVTRLAPEPGRSDAGVRPASTSRSAPGRPISTVDPVQALSRRIDEFEASVFTASPELAPAPGLSDARPVVPGADPSAAVPTGSLAPRMTPGSVATDPTAVSSGSAMIRGTGSWRDTTDLKQKGRWLLQLAREQIHKKHFDIAEQAIAEARALNLHWTVFDETPDRMTDALEKARAKFEQSGGARAGGTASPSAPTRDRRTAKARLKEARMALAGNDLTKAEEIASEVRSWGVTYGLFDDTPDRIEAAVFEARRREAMHNAELMVRSYYRGRGKERPQSEVDPLRKSPSGEAALPGPALPDSPLEPPN